MGLDQCIAPLPARIPYRRYLIVKTHSNCYFLEDRIKRSLMVALVLATSNNPSYVTTGMYEELLKTNYQILLKVGL